MMLHRNRRSIPKFRKGHHPRSGGRFAREPFPDVPAKCARSCRQGRHPRPGAPAKVMAHRKARVQTAPKRRASLRTIGTSGGEPRGYLWHEVARSQALAPDDGSDRLGHSRRSPARHHCPLDPSEQTGPYPAVDRRYVPYPAEQPRVFQFRADVAEQSYSSSRLAQATVGSSQV